MEQQPVQSEQEEQTQRLQSIVDKGKTISLLHNVHNLTPPQKREEGGDNQVAIIESLKSEPRIKEIFLEAQGQIWDERKKEVVQISRPLMNKRGAWKLVCVIKMIGRESEFNNYKEDEIPAYMEHFFVRHFPHFTFYHEDYNLDPSDFNYVEVTIQMFLLNFYKSKGGKQLNLLGRTYSEDMIGKIMTAENKKQQKEGFLDKLNPFAKKF